MDPKLEVCTGGTVLSLACASVILHDIYIVASFIAVVTGAILGVHGMYRWLVKGDK